MAHLGRRGLALLFFATLDLIYGYSLAFPDPGTRRSAQFVWLASIGPLWAWAALWVAVGIVCFVFAPRTHDRIGFACAIFLKVLWGLVCLGSWIFGDVERGYVSAAIWLAAAGFVGVISGWAEPSRRGPTWTPQTSSPEDR